MPEEKIIFEPRSADGVPRIRFQQNLLSIGIDKDKNATIEKMGTLQAHETGGAQQSVAYRTSGNCGVMEQENKTAALNCATDPSQQIIRSNMAVRRLTPTECCRLQGFPDDWNRFGVDENGDKIIISDTQRYKQMGNAVTVSVAKWIGNRIIQQHKRAFYEANK